MLLHQCVRSLAVIAIFTLSVGVGSAQQTAAQAIPVLPRTAVHSATTPIIQPRATLAKAVTPTDSYFRIICVVPLIGTGKALDPIRPDFVPVHKPGDAYHAGIIAWTQVRSDDGQHAIVEMVARSRSAFQPILNDKRPDVLVFEHGKQTQAQLEAGIQHYKKDFTLAAFPRAVAR